MANCLVSGTFTNPQGTAISGATVRFNTQTPLLDGSGILIMPKEITTTTATDGTWSLSIIQGIAGTVLLDLNPTTSSPTIKYSFSVVIPSTATSTFASCWVDSGSFGGQGTSSPLTFASISGSLATSQLPVLADANLWLGNSLGAAAAVVMSGDASLADTGALTVNTVGASSAANLHLAELAANAATDLDTISTIVKRDASGNFSAGTITASLAGNASTATLATTATTATTSGNFTGSLTGDVSGGQNSTAVNTVGGSTASLIHSAELAANAATNTNTVSTIVKRDGSGNFTAGTITAALTGNVTGNTSGSAGSFTGALVGDVTGTQGATALTATTNGTLSTLSSLTSAASLATVGTITSGTWSGSTIAVNKGGTGAVSLTANNVILGNGTNPVQLVDPGVSGNVLTSNGTTWSSAAVGAGGVTSAIVNINSYFAFS